MLCGCVHRHECRNATLPAKRAECITLRSPCERRYCAALASRGLDPLGTAASSCEDLTALNSYHQQNQLGFVNSKISIRRFVSNAPRKNNTIQIYSFSDNVRHRYGRKLVTVHVENSIKSIRSKFHIEKSQVLKKKKRNQKVS